MPISVPFLKSRGSVPRTPSTNKTVSFPHVNSWNCVCVCQCARPAMVWSNGSAGGCCGSPEYVSDTGAARDSELSLSPTGHSVVAACLGLISTVGFVNNLLALVLFGRHKALRSPINLLLINISLSDMLVCALATPFSLAASTRGRWLAGRTACVWYGFANSLFGIVSLISLAVLSYERYCTMMCPAKPDVTNYTKTAVGVVLSWVYSLVWTLPPFFGWSRYGPEGPGTTCSVDWVTKTANNISYIICLFVFCLILPFLVIVYSYGKLLHAIKQVSRLKTSTGRKREHRVLLMVLTMVVCYLLCWLPYGIMALLATFGAPGLVTAEASIVPSVLAKTSTVINPVIYVFMNKQFNRCFRSFLKCDVVQQSSTSKRWSKANEPVRRTENNLTFVAASVDHGLAAPSTSRSNKQPPSTDSAKPPALSLVARYNGSFCE
ncbi:teleost multiple tissue opsin a [Ictalurus furcatus]|uniref:teleost multiple tissue opsin a n=1 Tax=Ictalurus furcatus TaxID=66913 RepID=UPI0023508EDA|nr:teleost multiple tissue opsin a [Ictalurus furcatus]